MAFFRRDAIAQKSYSPCLIAIFVCLAAFACKCTAAPIVSNVTAASEIAAKYDPFTIDFDVKTTATNPYWPYDSSPPTSIPAKTGITADAIFSNDNWATTITVPAFYYQDYERHLSGEMGGFSNETEMPIGKPHWRIRFSPRQTGDWQFKIRATDATGTSESADSSTYHFKCVASSTPGFCRVSTTDPRYFELSDGTALLGPGINAHFHTTYEADSLLGTYGNNGVKLVRWWINYREWQNPFGGGSENPQWNFSLKMSNVGGAKPGDRYCALLNPSSNTYQSVYLNAGRLYLLKGYIRAQDVSGDASTGIVAYIGSQKTTPINGTQDWTLVSLTYTPTTSGRVLIGCKHNGSGGTAYFDDFSLKYSEDGGLTWSSECLSKGDFDFENYIDLAEAWKVDHVFEAAKANSVYLKTVISESQDYTLCCIGADGSTVSRSISNFYASADHPSRWLQKAWWRYMTARWGCYTSLHSWELCNEGDPFNANHYNAANALADYVHLVDPNKAMCTTSFWHSIPMEFWKTSSCDYIDMHEYIGAGSGSHGPRIYAWNDPATSASASDAILPIVKTTGTIDLDSAICHSGRMSLKLIANAGASTAGKVSICPEYHVGVNPAHTYTLRYFAKADSVANAGESLAWVRPGIDVGWSKAYHENDWVGGTSAVADLGTYDWRLYEKKGIAPPPLANTANIRPSIPCSPDHQCTFWIDDVEFIDETTGKNLFVDGGFECDRIDYDTALAVEKYGVLLDSYASRISKPVVWAETGIRGPNIYGSPYKGYVYYEENQELIDDTSGLWIKKMIWAHVCPSAPNMLYWWTNNIAKKSLWHYFMAFQSFMSGIAISNGCYEDACAITSSQMMRAWGQKDLINNRAHLWIDNRPYTWKNLVNSVGVPAISGTVTIAGLKDGAYEVEWWDTSTGVVTNVDYANCSSGNLVLQIANLQSDIACKIRQCPPKLVIKTLASTTNAVAGQMVTITVEYTNTSEASASDVIVAVRVPVGMKYVDGSADAGGTYNSTQGEVSWVIDSIKPRGVGTKSFKAVVE